jgi:hypothetical protein
MAARRRRCISTDTSTIAAKSALHAAVDLGDLKGLTCAAGAASGFDGWPMVNAYSTLCYFQRRGIPNGAPDLQILSDPKYKGRIASMTTVSASIRWRAAGGGR